MVWQLWARRMRQQCWADQHTIQLTAPLASTKWCSKDHCFSWLHKMPLSHVQTYQEDSGRLSFGNQQGSSNPLLCSPWSCHQCQVKMAKWDVHKMLPQCSLILVIFAASLNRCKLLCSTYGKGELSSHGVLWLLCWIQLFFWVMIHFFNNTHHCLKRNHYLWKHSEKLYASL